MKNESASGVVKELSVFDKNVFSELVEIHHIDSKNFFVFSDLIIDFNLKSKDILSAFRMLKEHNEKYTSKAYSYPEMKLQLLDFLPERMLSLCLSLYANVSSCVERQIMIPPDVLCSLIILKNMFFKLNIHKNPLYVLNKTNGDLPFYIGWVFEKRNPIGFTKEEQTRYLNINKEREDAREDPGSIFRVRERNFSK